MVLLDRREFSLLDEIERKFDLIVEAYSNDELVYGHHIGKINHVDLLYERSSSHFTDASHRITSTKAPFPTKYRYIFYVNVLETFNATSTEETDKTPKLKILFGSTKLNIQNDHSSLKQ